MAITGRLENISLPEVLQLLALGRKSGRLTIDSGASTGSVRFQNGAVTRASVRTRFERGNELSNGRGSADPTATGKRENSGLEGSDAARLPSGEPFEFLRRQILESVCLLFSWDVGTFHFEPAAPDEEQGLIHLSMESLLLEAARRADEQSREVPAGPSTTVAQPLGFTNRALESGEFLTALHSVIREMEGGQVCAGAFHSLALALEGLGRCPEALIAVREGLQAFPHDQALRLSEGILLTKLARIEEALGAFAGYEGAVGSDADHPEAFFVFSVLALAAGGRVADAIERAEQGISLLPDCAPLLLHAAVVKEQIGDRDEAASLYRRALRSQPTLQQAEHGLAHLLPSRAVS